MFKVFSFKTIAQIASAVSKLPTLAFNFDNDPAIASRLLQSRPVEPPITVEKRTPSQPAQSTSKVIEQLGTSNPEMLAIVPAWSNSEPPQIISLDERRVEVLALERKLDRLTVEMRKVSNLLNDPKIVKRNNLASEQALSDLAAISKNIQATRKEYLSAKTSFVEQLRQEALSALNERNFTEARSLVLEYIGQADSPEDFKFCLTMAQMHYQAGDNIGAMQLANYFIGKRPDSKAHVIASLALAKLAQQSKIKQQEVSYLKKALEHNEQARRHFKLTPQAALNSTLNSVQFKLKLIELGARFNNSNVEPLLSICLDLEEAHHAFQKLSSADSNYENLQRRFLKLEDLFFKEIDKKTLTGLAGNFDFISKSTNPNARTFWTNTPKTHLEPVLK
jgi:hypothetical protein